MAFELISAEINKLVKRRILHDVKIDRYLYQHSQARVVIDWDEKFLEGDRTKQGLQPTASLGAAMLNAKVKIRWRGYDLQPSVECFSGYVSSVEANHTATKSYVVLHCISLSKRTDLVPRYRVWQSCTLLDICQHIARDTTFQILPDAQSALGGISIDLSVQYEETDFAYLSRMLHAWGIPLSINDRTDKVCIGSPQATASGAFPGDNWHYGSVTLESELIPIDAQSRNPGGGSVGIAKKKVNQFNQGLLRTATGYQPRLDDDHLEEREWIAERVYDTAFQAHAAFYRIQWERAIFDCSPGSCVPFAGQTWMVRSSYVHGDPTSEAVLQEIQLQDYPSPLPMQKRRVSWPSRMFWAKVTKNYEEDPTREGRMQVEFDWEKLDATVQGDQRCWLPTLTPYAGLTGKSGQQGTSGLLCLPEVGERVLVQFLGEWDSDAVIVGSVREYERQGYLYDPHETKRLQTPAGNQITLTSRKDGSEIVRLKVKDQLVFEGKISGGKQTVIMDVFDSDSERIHFEKGSGPPRLDIFCSGEIYVSAGQKLLLEGGMVQIKSKTGPVNIDGAPMVMINCGPWSLQPLKREPEKGQEAPAKTVRKRAKPPKWAAAVAPVSAATVAAAAAARAEQSTFIAIELKDSLGNPVPNERYHLKLPDGSIQEGHLDANGRARVDGIQPGTAQVAFPDMDADGWYVAGQ